MKILVTGAAGAVGSHVAEALARAGHAVHCIDSFDPFYARELKDSTAADLAEHGIRLVELDLCTADLAPHLDGVEVIYHFAAQPGLATHVPFVHYVRNNLLATYHLLEAARRAGSVLLFVHISTSSVYGAHAAGDEASEPKPTSFYGVTKLAAEQLALAYHREGRLPVVVLRLFSVYGERERPEKLFHKFIKSVLNEEPFMLYEGAERHVRSYTHVADIVSGCLLALAHPEKAVGHIFNLGNDHTVTTIDALAALEKILGQKANVVRLPRRSGDQLETAANIQKARKLLGYNPVIRIEEGLAREAQWYREKVWGRA
ncbi:NAD-dependent epimerase/dehydratase family protein [Candidatus Kaiserbacteria bacterium]|nr:NAD-dependent epimerase/dehydratase family protein [Candidatus Kaiserbacteria bacterium]